jgi:hypothetical protein
MNDNIFAGENVKQLRNILPKNAGVNNPEEQIKAVMLWFLSKMRYEKIQGTGLAQ